MGEAVEALDGFEHGIDVDLNGVPFTTPD